MSQRPRDILEFLRRAGGGAPPVDEEMAEEAETTSRIFVSPPVSAAPVIAARGAGEPIELTPRQALIAGLAALLLAVLTYMIGHMVGENSAQNAVSAAPVSLWTIRVVEYDDTRSGEISAKTWASKIERLADDEVTIERLDRDRKLLVTLGSWLKNPRENERALRLLQWVRNLESKGGTKKPFDDAFFYPIKR